MSDYGYVGVDLEALERDIATVQDPVVQKILYGMVHEMLDVRRMVAHLVLVVKLLELRVGS